MANPIVSKEQSEIDVQIQSPGRTSVETKSKISEVKGHEEMEP